MSYLETYVDFGMGLELEVGLLKEWWTPELWEREEVRTLGWELAAAAVTKGIPRRLGQDASAEELAQDKLLSRRVEHLLLSALGQWGGTFAEMAHDDAQALSARKAGAQRDWRWWQLDRQSYLANRRRLAATYAWRARERLWGNQVVLRYNNEIGGLQDVFRDYGE